MTNANKTTTEQGIGKPPLYDLRVRRFRRQLARVAAIVVGLIAISLAGIVALFTVCEVAIQASGPSVLNPPGSQLHLSDFLQLIGGTFVVVTCLALAAAALYWRARKHDEVIRTIESQLQAERGAANRQPRSGERK